MTEKNIWLISDYHGVIAEEKGGKRLNIPLVDRSVTDEFLNNLNDLSAKEGLHTYYDILKTVFPNNADWSLDLSSPPTLVQQLKDTIFTGRGSKIDQFFTPFEIPGKNISGMKFLFEKDVKITICTGVPFLARTRFINEIKPLVGFLEPSLPVVLRPTDLGDLDEALVLAMTIKGMFSPHSYPSTSGLHLKLGVGSSIKKFSPNTKVVAIEDDYYVATCLSRGIDIRVYMPISYKEATSQAHLSRLKFPDSLKNAKEDIVFDSSFRNIYEDLITNG